MEENQGCSRFLWNGVKIDDEEEIDYIKKLPVNNRPSLYSAFRLAVEEGCKSKDLSSEHGKEDERIEPTYWKNTYWFAISLVSLLPFLWFFLSKIYLLAAICVVLCILAFCMSLVADDEEGKDLRDKDNKNSEIELDDGLGFFTPSSSVNITSPINKHRK